MAGRGSKKVDKKLIELSIYLAVLLFLVSFAGAYLGLVGRTSLVENDVSNTLVDMLSLLEIGEPTTCDLTTLHIIGDELDRIGRILSTGKYPDYLLKYYVLLEYKHYKLVESYNEDCNASLTPILFFITKDCPKCDAMAGILMNLKQSDPEHIYVYTFNATIDSPIVRYLLRRYNVQSFPTIIVENNVCHTCTYSELERLVGEKR